MATYRNITGAKLVVQNEFHLPVTFEPGETKSGLSNYLERYTSTYITDPEDLMLARVGALDGEGEVPVAVIEEENMAVRPSKPNVDTLGVNWGKVGGVRSSAIPAGYVDPTNAASTRLRRIGFDTEDDTVARQIDTRYLDVKENILLAANASHVDAAVDISAGSGDVDLDTATTVVKRNGRRVTAADVANGVYGSLLTEGEYVTAFGTAALHDDAGTAADQTIGFVVRGAGGAGNWEVTDTTVGGLTVTNIELADADTLTWTITGTAASDTLTATVFFAQDVYNATTANTQYDADDGLRGWYNVTADATTGVVAGVLLLTDDGILHMLDAAAIDFVAWS